MKPSKVLLRGRPGSGKTTLVQRLLERLPAVAGGFVTEEMQEGGRRVGFKVRDVATGEEAVLAREGKRGGPRVGRYVVDVEVFDRVGVGALRAALEREGVIVVDEIGKMELCSPVFAERVEHAFDLPRAILATVPAYRLPLVDKLLKRPGVTVAELTPATRDELLQKLTALFRG